ncbi:MAG: trimeric intracellular cation channel family protein [Proteobacteria bacterium]|nr:trimeric intracellular cation channel family protein [Pseudomonadota bacterium]
MQAWLEHFGIAVAALTGVLAARGRRVDLFGVVVLAIVTALGGGTLRDLLTGDTPVLWVRQPEYLINAVTIAVAGFFIARHRQPPLAALQVADAFALALFSIIGAKKALGLDLSPSVVVAMGVITGVAGGILRDVLVGEIPLVFRPAIHLYATAALAGVALHVFLRPHVSNESALTILSTGTILVLRLAAIRWRLALPLFEAEQNEPRKPY